ncbi:hypothetical protein [Spirosoma endophyticum]|uniref:hypothetical protein n=1 Tax=Spirosoma endophyticum TaxID=662367 RepID=UPI001C43570C|nr:hypothetical protein [Spirosoma endophyticum]
MVRTGYKATLRLNPSDFVNLIYAISRLLDAAWLLPPMTRNRSVSPHTNLR